MRYPSGGDSVVPPPAALTLHYTLYSTLLTAKQFSFGIFSIALR
jgi:hypothetical protein